MGWWWTLLLLHLPLVIGMLPAPVSVTISSFNLEHSLTWQPGAGTPTNTLFRVHTLSLRNNSWKPAKGCANLKTSQACDLTKVLKVTFTHYRARVQAFTPSVTSNWTLSTLFHPLTDTVVGPPVVSVSGCGNCLLLQVTPPTSRGFQRPLSLASLFYRDFTCQVQRTRDGSRFSLRITSTETENETVIDYLEPGAEYCVTVTTATTFNRHLIPSDPHCAFTSPAASRTAPVVLSVLCALCLLVSLFCGVVICSGHLVSLLLPKTLSSVPLYGQGPPKAELEVFNQLSVLSHEAPDWIWTPLHSDLQQGSRRSLEEEEEDEGYGQMVSRG